MKSLYLVDGKKSSPVKMRAMPFKMALLSLLSMLCAFSAVSEEISSEQSQVAVEAWMKKYGSITGKTVRRIETITNQTTGAQIHVAVLRGGGFVVTAADDRVLPVMAYSETGTFVNDPENPLLQLLHSDASAAKKMFGKDDGTSPSGGIRASLLMASAPVTDRTDAQKEWDDLLGRTTVQTTPKARLLAALDGESSNSSSHTEKRVEPLLRDKRSGKQLLWGQLTHNDQKDFGGGGGLLCYNYYTPEWPEESAPIEGQAGESDNIPHDDSRLSTHYPCGCVATAGAMIMKKWEHPKSGYSFSSMPADPAKNSNETGRKAIGKLTRAIGNACGLSDSDYGPETSMATETMVAKLVDAFSYCGAFWQYMNDSDFTAGSGSVCNFDRQVIPNLIAECPVSMKLAGHSVVVDGLRYIGSTRKIHVNFGWLIKSANAWYVPQTFRTVGGTYTSVKGVGINIHPTQRKAIIAGRVAAVVPSNGGMTLLNGGLKGASVVLKKNGSKVNDCSTDKHGQFFFLADSGTYSLEITKAGYSATTVEGVTVTCSNNSVSNYYKDDIYLQAESSERVGDVNVTKYSMDNGSWYRISMSCETEGAAIHYTIDGSLPTEDSPLYSEEFPLRETGTITLRAIAFKNGLPPSKETSGDITFRESNQNTQLRLAASLTSSAGRTSLNNASATKESGEPTHSVMGKAGGASMWASFTAPEDGDYTFTASGVSADDEDYSLDTQLAVYTGDSVSTLSLVAANDDVDAAGYDLSSKVAFHAVKGTTYKIAVDTRNGAKGTIALEWKQGREDVASPAEYDVYYTAERNTYSIPVRSTATWYVCDGSDWITVKKSSGKDGESLTFELPEMTEEGTRSGVLMICAGEDGPSSTIKITQGTTSWVTSRADALATAKANGKRILIVCGRDTCSNTSYTRFTACEDASVKPLLIEGYVLWYCNCDEQWEDYAYYTSGLGGYTLPLVCIIDPVKPEEYVARSTGLLTAAKLKQILQENSEGNLPTVPFEVSTIGDDAAGSIAISYASARRAQSYEIWRGTKWSPAEAVRIASDVRSGAYVDKTAEPSVLYYYRVRAVNGVGVSEFSAPVTGCWRESGALGDAAIGNALGAPHLDWVTEGDHPWTVQGTNTYDGAGAMQSAFTDPKQSGVTSVLKTTVTGPTRMSFRYKTRMYSSRFVVKVDDVESFLETGAVGDWTLAEVDIPEGVHEITFSYTKGGYYTSGFNGVYLDAVQFDVLSRPPTLTPATTDDEDTAFVFTGSMTVSISSPEGSVVYYTIDGSEPTTSSPVYDGPFSINASTRVSTMCVQNGYDNSTTASGLYLERHPVQAGEWTTDVEGAKKAALKNGSIIVTLLGNYETCGYTRAFAAVAETAEFLSWAKANGVYLITADSSRWIDANAAYSRFWDLFYDAGQSGSVYYPALAIANAWEPGAATGYAVARSGQSIGSVQYDGTVSSLEAGLESFFKTRPSNTYVWVEFDGNGGTPYERSMVGILGQAIGDLPMASRSYHYFDGWYTSAVGGMEVTAETVLSADTVCFAHWTPYSYRVQFNANGGAVSPSYKYVSYGMEYGDLPMPTRADSDYKYTFDGWYTAASGGTKIVSSTRVMITSTQTLYAHWIVKPITYTITYNPGSYGEGVAQTSVKIKNVPLALDGATFTRTGHTQTGWSKNISGNTKDYELSENYTSNADVDLYPYWAINIYTVTFNANGGTGGVTKAQNYGTAISVPTVERANYSFIGWVPEVDATVPASNVTYTAQWRCEWSYSKTAEGALMVEKPNFTPAGKVVVPSEIDGMAVAGIADRAFENCTGMTEVSLPSGLKSIGFQAFRNCTDLTTMIVPNGVTNVGAYAFCDCTGLTNVSIPDSVTTIEQGTFCNCVRLADLAIPNTVTSIGDEAFSCCSNLTSIAISSNVQSIGYCTFSRCRGLTNVTIRSGVTSIGRGAFEGCDGLTSLTVPDSVTWIGSGAFNGCSSLGAITLPFVGMAEGHDKSPEALFGYVFGEGSFEGGMPIKQAYVTREYEYAYDSSYSVFYVPQSLESVTITRATMLGSGAFYGCTNIVKLTLPGSITSVGKWAILCSSLRTLIIDSDTSTAFREAILNVSTDCTIKVPNGSTGWEVDIPGMWNSWKIDYIIPIVQFDPNGGSVSISEMETLAGSIAFEMPVPIKTGHSYTGWFSGTEGGEKIRQGMVLDGSIRAYAQWTQNVYSVAFDANGGTGGVTNLQNYGSEIVAPAVSRDGYAFLGWSPEVDATVPASNLTYTAQWEVNQYTVTFDANGGTGGWCDRMDYATAIIAPTVTRTGYTFTGWSPSVAATVPAGDITYTAQWEVNQYTVTFDANGGIGEMAEARWAYETVTNVPPCGFRRTGHSFAGWATNEAGVVLFDHGDSVSNLTSAADGVVTLFAVWSVNSYTLTFDSDDGSAVAPITQNYGTEVVPPAVPTRMGYKFLGWAPELPETMPAEDRAFKAQWIAGCTVTLNANGGTLEEATNTVLVAKGKAVGALPVPTREGYSFTGWYTKKSGGTKITTKTKVTKDVAYYAHWTAKKYKVSAAVSAKAAGSVSGAGAKTYGSKVTLKATPKKGYVFVKWVNLNDPDTPWPSALKCRQPSVAFTMGAGAVSVRAVFAKASADAAPVLTVESASDWYVESEPNREISVAAESLSHPTVTLSGAPAGIGLVRVPETDCEYVLKVTDASKVKPGVYTAKITAKNRAGKSAVKSVRIVAPNSSAALANGLISGLETSTLSPYVAVGGMKTEWTLADLGVEVFATNGWRLASVTGLPTGLSWNGSAIVGAASALGVYTATFTMKKTVGTGKNAKTYTSTANATFKVEVLLPDALAGTYNGFANTSVAASDEGDEAEYGEGEGGDEETYGIYTPVVDGWASAAKVTVTTSGKITANIGGVALSGSGFDDVSNGVYSVTLSKKQKITKGSLKGKTKVWEAYFEIDTNAAWDARQLVGWYQTYTTGLSGMTAPAWIVAQRNPFGANGSDDAKAVAAAVAKFGTKGVVKFKAKSVKGQDYSYDLVSGTGLTVTAKATGTVTLAGKVGSTKVSGTATLEMSEAETVKVEQRGEQATGSRTPVLKCADDCEEPVQVVRRTATARFFSGNFVVEIVYVLESDEDGTNVNVSGKVWKK